MLSRHIVDQIKALLDQKQLSQRAIARRLGVSRGTVNSIATGRRIEAEISDETLLHDRPPERCPGCGGLVYLPCLLCEIRQLKRLERGGTNGHARPSPLSASRRRAVS